MYLEGGTTCRDGEKRFEEGIDLLSRASSLQPGNPDAVYNLGNVFKDAERWDEAISSYERALELKSENPKASPESKCVNGQASCPKYCQGNR